MRDFARFRDLFPPLRCIEDNSFRNPAWGRLWCLGRGYEGQKKRLYYCSRSIMVPLIGVVAAASVGYVFRVMRSRSNGASATEELAKAQAAEGGGNGKDNNGSGALNVEMLALVETGEKNKEADRLTSSLALGEKDPVYHDASTLPPPACENGNSVPAECISTGTTMMDCSEHHHSGKVRRLIANYGSMATTGDGKPSASRVSLERTKSQVYTATCGSNSEVGEYSGAYHPQEEVRASTESFVTLIERSVLEGDVRGSQPVTSVEWVMRNEQADKTDWWDVEDKPPQINSREEEGEEDDEYGLRCIQRRSFGRYHDDDDGAQEIDERDVVCVEETPAAASTSKAKMKSWQQRGDDAAKCGEFLRSAPESSSDMDRIRVEEILAMELLKQREIFERDAQNKVVELEEKWRRTLESERAGLLKQIVELERVIQEYNVVGEKDDDFSNTSLQDDDGDLGDEGELESVWVKRLESGSRHGCTDKPDDELGVDSEFLERALLLNRRIDFEDVNADTEEVPGWDDDEHVSGDNDVELHEEASAEDKRFGAGFLQRAMLLQHRLQHESRTADMTENSAASSTSEKENPMWGDDELIGSEATQELTELNERHIGETESRGLHIFQRAVSHKESSTEDERFSNTASVSGFSQRAMILQHRLQHKSETAEVTEHAEANNTSERKNGVWGDDDLGEVKSTQELKELSERHIDDKTESGPRLDVFHRAMLLRNRSHDEEGVNDEVVNEEDADETDDKSSTWMWDVRSDQEAEAMEQLKEALQMQKSELELEHRKVVECIREEYSGLIDQMKKEWEEKLQREIKQVRELSHQEWERRLVQKVGEGPATNLVVEMEDALKSQRLALEADHKRTVDDIREKNLEVMEAERKDWEKVRAEWEERAQSEREDYIAESKQEMEHALYLQKLILEEEHVKSSREARESELLREKEMWEAALEQEGQRVRGILQMEWEERLEEEMTSIKAHHDAETSQHLELALEAQRITLDAEYTRLMEEKKEKEDMKWMRKLELEREALLSMAKKIVAQEREKFKATLEAEWNARQAEEKVQRQQQFEQEQEREWKKLDDKIRKETVRLELRAADLDSKEIQMRQRSRDEADKLRFELAAVRSQLESVQGYQVSREALLKATENDHFDEANFRR